METTRKKRKLDSKQIKNWLDEDLQIVSKIEEKNSEKVEFRYIIWCKNFNINLFKPKKDGPIVLATESMFPKQKLDILQGNKQNHFIPQITSILTLTPGFYTFTDGNGKSTNLKNMEAIYIEHRIYPDKASQHELMNSIINIFTALMYVQSTADRIIKNKEKNR